MFSLIERLEFLNFVRMFHERFCGTYCKLFIDFNVLRLGGPELCQDDFPSNYTFDVSSSPKIYITFCGVPQPVVQGEFINQKFSALNTTETVNGYIHNFTLQIPQLTQEACGKTLTITANGNNVTLTETTKIFLEKCKYFSYFLFIIFSRLSMEGFHISKRSPCNI